MPEARLLIVDDEPADRELLSEYLANEDYELIMTSDGVEAWSHLDVPRPQIDVVLLDVRMPRMGGIELLKRIKADPRFEVVPVIIQTAATEREHVLDGIRAGAYYYLTKPHDAEVLRSIVHAAIHDSRNHSQLRKMLHKGMRSLSLMREAVFTFRTIDDAKDLGTTLAQLAPDPERTVIGLTEMLVNAIEHGNLGITYDDKTRLNATGEWTREVARRLSLDENFEKRAIVHVIRDNGRVSFTIRDQGTGFDWTGYMTIDPRRAFDSHGRGIAIASLMSFSSVEYRGCGNEVVCTIVDHEMQSE